MVEIRIRRRAVLALGAAGALPGAALAQGTPEAWPGTQPVRLVVPFAAGGTTDIFARLAADRFGATLGGRFIVENRPGAGGALGAAAVARAAPDGRTLLMVTSSHMVNETLAPDRGYVLLRDFSPVAPFNTTAIAITVTPALPVTTLAELIAHARANPGALSYATTGIGTVNHLAGEVIASRTGIRWEHVPYRAGTEARNDLMAGRVAVMMDVAPNAAELARAGRVRVLAVTTAARSVALPDVPTVAEAGLAGFDIGVLIGLMAPAGTPRAIIDRLAAASAEMARAPEVVAIWRAQAAEPVLGSPEEFGAMLAEDVARWARVIREAGVVRRE